MSNKSGKKSNKNNRVNNIPSNLFISWNKDDNICIPLKMKNTTKNKNLSSKKIKIPAFPILEDSKKNKRLSSSVKLLETENSYLIPKIKKIDSEQTKINNILPKINSNSAKAIASINNNDRKRKSFSYFKDNKNAINSVNINNNLNSHSKKNSFEKKIIKNYFALSQAGKTSNGATKTNQDSYLVLTKINNFSNFNVFGIFDGHGPDGHLVSQFLVKYFSDFFHNNPEIKKCQRELEIFNLLIHLNYKILRDSIILSEEKLKEQKDINLAYSGSTCCMIIQIYQKIICANIGDSRAILLSEMIKEDISNLSNDHKPILKKELERIKKYGGVVEKCIYEDGIADGPFRVWNNSKQEYPGLAISRSIGDIEATKLGVIAEPDFYLKTLKGNMKYIIIASDGIWEYLNNKNVCDIIKPFYILGDAKGAAEKLIKESGEKWAKEGKSADDITVIIIYF
jgi:serine/threonine protein phosphatase PrpC